MPRLACLPPDVAKPAELVEAIRARRGGALKPVDRMLLHSPVLAHAWHVLLRAVDDDLALDAPLRLLAACAVTRAHGVDDLFMQLAQDFLRAGGTSEQLGALNDLPAAIESRDLFTPPQRAVLALCQDMTRRVQVTENHFAAIRALLPAQEAVELVGVIAAYNMVVRVLVALDVGVDDPPTTQACH